MDMDFENIKLLVSDLKRPEKIQMPHHGDMRVPYYTLLAFSLSLSLISATGQRHCLPTAGNLWMGN